MKMASALFMCLDDLGNKLLDKLFFFILLVVIFLLYMIILIVKPDGRHPTRGAFDSWPDE